MSQRECAGFNWPGFPVSAGDPVGVGPECASQTVRRLLSVFPAGLLPFCAGVPAIGVGQPASRATSFNGLAFVPQRSCVAPFQSRAEQVGQGAAICTTSLRLAKPGLPFPSALQRDRIEAICSGVFGVALSCVCGVGHEPEPLPDMRSADARSAQISLPDGVALSFQVSVNKVEPTEAVLARNLLAKDRCRSALADEMVPSGP